MKKILLLFAAFAALVSCKSTKALLPNVSGKAGEIIVVIDKADWEGNLGTKVRELLACDCPYLAQREPLYSLVNVPPGGFGDLFKAPVASLLATMITLVLVDMFDTIGTLIGAADKAGYLDEKGDLPKIEKAMLADAIATSTGAVLGTSTVTTYVESTAGISAGGKTGLTSTVTGLCFLLALFLSPIVGLVPSAATAPILIVVGVMMCGSLKDIKWDDIEVAIPCFLTVACMPFFYSITDGLAFGFISYVIVKLAKGKVKEIHPLMYVIVALFVLKYVISALNTLGIL